MAIAQTPIHSLQFLILTLSLTFPSFHTQSDTITTASPITDPDAVVSAGGVFKLGFFTPTGAARGRYLAVFYAVSERTAIWIANRENPLPDSSGRAAISGEGNLVLLNGRNQTIWTTNISSSPATTAAQILDAGNIVLTDVSTGRILWDSFSHPTNVFVPNFKLLDNLNTGEKVFLSSSKNESTEEMGAFTAGLQAHGVPQIFIWKNGSPHWRSGPWNGRILVGIEDMYAPFLYFTLDQDPAGVFNFFLSKGKLLIKIVLNSTGSLVETFWNDRNGNWDVTWLAPKNECELYGRCGAFGICSADNSPICSCIKGFEPANYEEWEKGNWSGGCIRKKGLECNGKGGEGFLRMGFMKVPDFANRLDLEWKNEDGCRKGCLGNCSCTAYAFDDEGLGCLIWTGSLVDLQRFSSVGVDLHVRLVASELGHYGDKKVLIIVIPIVLAFVAIIVCIFIGRHCIGKTPGDKMNDTTDFSEEHAQENSTDRIAVVVFNEDMGRVTIDESPIFTYEMLSNATNVFDNCNMVGKGGFGLVYKGRLENGKEIAVKRLSATSGQGMEEFMNEVVLISKLQHWNLVRLLGCCVENEEKMLVYEYMPNKSLDLCIFDPSHPSSKILDWKKRLNIIEGIGRGLLYLHRDSRLKIIHRDLKPSNILLDVDLNPKISDFGMARIFGGNNNEDQANTRRVVGTYGYMAPEYAMDGIFSEKTDVYSFGVLMLEIVSGRRNTNYYNHEWSLSLLGCAWKMWSEGDAMDFVDGSMDHMNCQDEILRCIQIGLLCVQEIPKQRPSIQTVLSMLTGEITDMPLPEKPVFADKWSHFQVGLTDQATLSQTLTVAEGR